MDAIEAILSRKAVREFDRKPVAIEQLAQIIDAGRHAMSARNLQPWNFILVRDPKTLQSLGNLCTTGRFVADAQAAVVLLKDRSNQRWADNDCAQSVQNMADAGWALGLGTCWVGNFDADQIARLLGIPEGWGVFTVLPFGYPKLDRPPQPKALKPRRQVVHYERFGQSNP